MFMHIFSKESCHVLIEISLKWIPYGPLSQESFIYIDNDTVLVEVMAWRQTGYYLNQ